MDPCAEALHQLYTVLDGEHTEQEVREHFELCLPCAQALDFEAELKLLIATKCRERAPEALRARIAEIISREPLSRE
jgi:mycothiol system anti-sigma-R factor